MHITDRIASRISPFSFEVFPPRTPEGTEKLVQTLRELETLEPTFVSITYGAGGSTRDLTSDLVARVQAVTSLHPVPHLTGIGHSAGEIEETLSRYAQLGVNTVLALRGDPPREGKVPDGNFRFASELVRAIRKFSGHPDPRGFGIGVAGFPEGHPATPNRLREMDYLKAKVEAGADTICTQFFFDNRDFHDFRARCELAGIRVPILAGVMPVTSLSGLGRLAELAGGARIPARLLKALHRAEGDPDAERRIGLHYATEQCADLLQHDVAGIHLYTMNQSAAALGIFRNLGLGGKKS